MIGRDEAFDLLADLFRAFAAAVVLGVVLKVAFPREVPVIPCVVLFAAIGLRRAWDLGRSAPAAAVGFVVLVLLGAFGVAKLAPFIDPY